MITSTTTNATMIDNGMAAPALPAPGIGRNKIAAAGVITASDVMTACLTLRTPWRSPGPVDTPADCCAADSSAAAIGSPRAIAGLPKHRLPYPGVNGQASCLSLKLNAVGARGERTAERAGSAVYGGRPIHGRAWHRQP